MSLFVDPFAITPQERAETAALLRAISAKPVTEADIDAACDHQRAIKQLVTANPNEPISGFNDANYVPPRTSYWD